MPSLRFRCFALIVGAALAAQSHAQQGATPRNGPESGTVVSRVSGEEVRFLSETEFRPLVLGQDLLGGDLVRTGPRGVVGILFVDGTVMRLHPETELLVRSVGAAARLELRRGTVWARSPRGQSDVTVTTPSATAGIRGTDWVLSVTGALTQLTVYDGAVELSNPQGSLLTRAGEAAQAVPGRAPYRIGVANRREAPQMLYTVQPGEAAQLIIDTTEDLAKGEEAEPGVLAAYRDASRRVQQDDSRAAEALDQIAPRLGPERRAAARWLAAIARSRQGEALRPPPATVAEADAVGAAFVAAMSGDLDRAQAALRSVASSPAATEAAVTLAILRDDAALARSLASDLERRDPGAVSALVATASIASDIDGDPVTAVRLLRRAAQRAPDRVAILNALALAESAVDHPLEAEAAYRRALALQPGNPLILGNLAVLLLETERIDEAKAIGKQLVADDPGSYLGLRVLGRAALQDGDEEAQRHLLKALAAQPAAAETSVMLGAASIMSGDRNRGQQELDAAARLDPNDPVVPLAASITALEANQADQAILAARRAAELLNLQNRIGARIAADRQTGSPLANAYATIGLPGWARYTADRTFDPLSAGSLFTEGQLSRMSIGRGGPSADGFDGSFVNGLRLEPLSASFRLGYADLFRRPFLDLEIGTSGSQDQISGEIGMQGLARLPVPVAFAFQINGVDARQTPGADQLRGGLGLVGTQFGARAGLFTVFGGDIRRTSKEWPLGFGLSNIQSDETTTRTTGIGGHLRLSERSFLVYFGGRSTRDISNFARNHALVPAGLFRIDTRVRTRSETNRLNIGWQSEDASGFWNSGMEYFDFGEDSDIQFDVTNLRTGRTTSVNDSQSTATKATRIFFGRRHVVNPVLTAEGMLTFDRVGGDSRPGGRVGLAWMPVMGQWLRAAAIVDGNPFLESLAPATVVGLVPLRFPFESDGESRSVILRYEAELTGRLLVGTELQYLDVRRLTFATDDPAKSFDAEQAKVRAATVQADWWIGGGFGLSGSLTRASGRVVGGPSDGSSLPEVPDWTAVLGIGWLRPSGFGGNLRAVWTSERFSGVPGSALPPALTVDAALTWESRNKRVSAALAVANLLDHPLAQPWGLPATGRDVRASLTMRF